MLLACSIALACPVPGSARAEDILWYVPDAQQAETWSDVSSVIWRGPTIRFDEWPGPWPPDEVSVEAQRSGAVADDAPPVFWIFWVGEGPAAGREIVGLGPNRDEPWRTPLAVEGESTEAVARVALLLAMSTIRTIEVDDAGWTPGADDGADDEPVAEVPDPATLEPPPPAVEPTERRGPRPEVGLGVGLALRQDAQAALAPALRFTLRAHPLVGPGFQVGLETLGSIDIDPYRIVIWRLLPAFRWQFTPASGRWSFPVAVGVGAGITTGRIADQPDGEPDTRAQPFACAEAGVAVRVGTWISLGVAVDLAVDLGPYRVVVETGAGEQEGSLGPVSLRPAFAVIMGR